MVTNRAIGGRVDRFPGNERSSICPVAINTPTHRKGLYLPATLHRFHGSVTDLARHAHRDMPAVIEGYKSGQIVHPHPLDRPARLNRA